MTTPREIPDEPCEGDRGALSRQISLNRMSLLGGIWLAFVVGTISGGYSQWRLELKSLLLPLCGLALIIVLDLIWLIHRD